VTRALLLAVVLLLAGCGAQTPKDAFLWGADSVAPAKYDTDAEQVNAGRAVCLQHRDGKTDDEIAESIVFWSERSQSGPVPRGEAARLVPYALQHCGWLLSPEAEAVIEKR
jgi:hypothetical protein